MKTDRSPLPVGTVHTLRDIRLKAEMPQQELAHRANVTPGVVLKMEQFILNKVPLSVIRVLETFNIFDPDLADKDLQEVYAWERQAFIDTFFERFALNDYTEHFERASRYANQYTRLSADGHPVRLFRQHLSEDLGIPASQIKFCMYTGFHPATLSNIESGKCTWRECSSFIEILKQMRVPDHIIVSLGHLNDYYFLRAR